ncbi:MULTISPECIES: hypothetical protein [unclassified Microbacterium]|uniref:hypothetical protein n=1 Tax=unclassified Microbacterium TaxID=2609290 RepID=UPI00386731E7
MSAPALDMLIAAQPAERPGQGRDRRLRAVPAGLPRRRPKLIFGVIALAGALSIGAAQMALSIATTQGAYEVQTLTSQQRQATWDKQILQEQVDGLSSPQFLAANASALGLVAGGDPNYLKLSDGSTLGEGKGAPDRSSVQALSRAAVDNALVSGVPLVTDPEASLESSVSVDEKLLLDTPTPPAITDGLPTPTTH